MQILPAIDIINGKCVRLTKGDYNTEIVYNDNPLEMAKQFEFNGAEYLHIVDLDAAVQRRHNLNIIGEIAKNTNLKIEMGGGIRNEDTLKNIFDLGIYRAIIGSKALTDEKEVSFWIEKYGNEKIVLGADIINNFIAIDGWKTITKTSIDDFIIRYNSYGADTFICTEISVDGTLDGIAIALYKRLMKNHAGIKLIASGGVGSMKDIINAKENDMYGIIVGKAIYENRISLNELFL
jgi:phosphoribosylformimino-5-aminoimidazole carboxamide ribotide isomerase